MTCKVIDSPDRFSSSTQPRYVTVWYCLTCAVPYLISKLISFLVLFCAKQYELSIVFPKMNAKFVINKPIAYAEKKNCWGLYQLLWHLCVGTVNKSHLRKGTIHSLQPRTCHCHKIETKGLYDRSVWYSTVDVSNIGILTFDIDLKSSIREVRFKLCSGSKRKFNQKHFFNKILWFLVSNV